MDKQVSKLIDKALPLVTKAALAKLAPAMDSQFLEHVKLITQPDDRKHFRTFMQPKVAAEYLGCPLNKFRNKMLALEERGALSIARRQSGIVEARTLTIEDVVTIGRHLNIYPERQPGDPVIKAAIANQKGGVGKTVTTINAGVYSATKLGQRTLIVDLDPQHTQTRCFAPFLEADDITVATLILNADKSEDEIRLWTRDAVKKTHVPNLDILPAANRDSDVERQLAKMEATEEGFYKRLSRVLKSVEDRYDVILFDTSPSNNLAALLGLYAANAVIIPTGADYYEIDSMSQFVEFLNDSVPHMEGHSGFNFIKSIITRYEEKTQKLVANSLRAQLSSTVLDHACERKEAIGWATQQLGSIYEVDPNGLSPTEKNKLRDTVKMMDKVNGEIFDFILHCWPSRKHLRNKQIMEDPAFLRGQTESLVMRELQKKG